MGHKKSGILLIILFMLVVFMPHIVWYFAEQPLTAENTENRTLAQKPSFSLKEFRSYPQAYEQYYNDHLPFRKQMITLYNCILYNVFHSSSNERVVLGNDGWLFYGNKEDGDSIGCYDGSLMLTDKQLELIAQNLVNARDKLEEIGSEFVLFIAPNKERVYSEFMPSYYGQPAERCMVNQVIAYLRENTDIRIVYPYQELIEQKKNIRGGGRKTVL